MELDLSKVKQLEIFVIIGTNQDTKRSKILGGMVSEENCHSYLRALQDNQQYLNYKFKIVLTQVLDATQAMMIDVTDMMDDTNDGGGNA